MAKDQRMQTFQETFSAPFEAELEALRSKVSLSVSRVQRPFRILMVSLRQKRSLQCSAECFSVEEFTVKEAYDCQGKCEQPLERLKTQQERLFALWDVRAKQMSLNNCLHSCTKQKRKSAHLSGETVNCYNDCLRHSEALLNEVEETLVHNYSIA